MAEGSGLAHLSLATELLPTTLEEDSAGTRWLSRQLLRRPPLLCSSRLHWVSSSRARPHRPQLLPLRTSPCRWVKPDSLRRRGEDDSVLKHVCTARSLTTSSSPVPPAPHYQKNKLTSAPVCTGGQSFPVPPSLPI